MQRFVLRWAINTVAVLAAVWLLRDRGLELQGQPWPSVIVLGLIMGLLNAVVRPILKLLTCPLILLTLGLFTLVINIFLFWLAGQIGTQFGLGFTASSLAPIVYGGLIVTVVSVILTLVLRDELN